MKGDLERKVDEGKQELFTLRQVPSAKLAPSWDKLGPSTAVYVYCTSFSLTVIIAYFD